MYINVRAITWTIAGIVIALLGAHLFLQYFVTESSTTALHIAQRFDVDEEASVPTWMAQSLLLCAGLLAAGIAALSSKERRSIRYGWWGVALVLFLMSIDEGASFHETLGVWAGQIFGSGLDLGFIILRDWVILGLLLVVICGVLFWRFAWSLPARTRLLLVLAAVTFVAGAAFWESLHFTTFGFDHDSTGYAVSASNAVEEGLEMFGSTIALYALLDYLQRYHSVFTVRFKPPRKDGFNV